MTEPRSTPLRTRHESLGASFTDFGGWWMPVRYSSDLAEHHAVRHAAGIFDVSHMAEFVVAGAEAAPFLDEALSGRLSAVAVGRARYSLLLAEDGGVIDDVIVYRLGEDRFLVVSNAGNRGAVHEALSARSAAFRADVDDVSDDHALIAVQGPHAERILTEVGGIRDLGVAWPEQRAYGWTSATYAGTPLLVARTGYTGEDGFELLVDSGASGSLWDEVTRVGAPHGLVPAGLAARDTLRLEAGMPLYGHELSRAVTPAQAGLAWAVDMTKETFVGKDSVIPPPGAPVLVGIRAGGRRAARSGYAVLDAHGAAVGEVTSGALSPTLGYPVALAYVDPVVATVGTPVVLDVRGTRIPATVTTLPFYRRKR